MSRQFPPQSPVEVFIKQNVHQRCVASIPPAPRWPGQGLRSLLQFYDGQWQDVPAVVAWMKTPSDWAHVFRWRGAARGLPHEAVRDSLEYAALASKRWRFLRGSGTAPDSLPGFLRLSGKDPDAETG